MSAQIIVTRSSLRAALSSVLPHAGKSTKENPRLGVLRWHMTGEGLLVWATDLNTTACALIDVVEHLTPEAESWYTTAHVARKILTVFKSSSTRDEDGDLTLQVSTEQLHLTETGGLLPGESLKVPRISVPKDDEYPDVPRVLHAAATAPVTTFGHAFVDWSHLAAFEPSLRALGYKGHLTVVDGERPSLLIRAGKYFIGTVQRLDGAGDEARRVDERTTDRAAKDDWATHLAPLRKEVKVKLTPFQEDHLTEQALAAIAEHGAATPLRVVPAHYDPFNVHNDEEQD